MTGIASGLFPVVRTVAFVDVNPEHDPGNRKFGENVGVNRGVHVRVFPDVAGAQAWLGALAS